MTVELINPPDHVVVPEYHHVAVGRGAQIHIAGQVSWDADGNLVGPGDLTAQVAQVYRNIAGCLTAAGATFHDVVRITWFVVGWRSDMADAFGAGRERVADELDLATPPTSLIGVASLYEDGILVEAEVTAAVA